MGKGNRLRVKRQMSAEDAMELLQQPMVKKAIQKEVGKHLKEAHQRFYDFETAVILWTLHQIFGFGKERLRKYYDQFNTEWEKLKDYYEMGDLDISYICTEKLKEIGVDVEAWNREK